MAVATENNRFFRAVTLWSVVLAVMGLIYYFSSLPAKRIPCLFPHSDIVFHLAIFGLLAFCFSRAMEGTFRGMNISRLVLYSVIFCTAYGISDEYHQLFVGDRCCSGLDIFVDSAGAFAGSMIFCFKARLPLVKILFAK
ncbi:MAG: VanZ family protein [Candidatus Omnitrophica bacterium]|nr:VanZ family protein [Candidatus Omnitrophota bacterium]MDD5653469.1 VanZ family protein [Candidatus Omnitrophota bacterium]